MQAPVSFSGRIRAAREPPDGDAGEPIRDFVVRLPRSQSQHSGARATACPSPVPPITAHGYVTSLVFFLHESSGICYKEVQCVCESGTRADLRILWFLRTRGLCGLAARGGLGPARSGSSGSVPYVRFGRRRRPLLASDATDGRKEVSSALRGGFLQASVWWRGTPRAIRTSSSERHGQEHGARQRAWSLSMAVLERGQRLRDRAVPQRRTEMQETGASFHASAALYALARNQS
jgi:hypothetical protein